MAEIELKTAPADFRFPTTNQTRHCFTRYIEYHKCLNAKGEDASECQKFARYYRSLCPMEWHLKKTTRYVRSSVDICWSNSQLYTSTNGSTTTRSFLDLYYCLNLMKVQIHDGQSNWSSWGCHQD
ncbi:uncharacterized protein [Elaeis guineensis]|uniref:uncharacterized protein isoform X1 n=1 Tax=Elaeis guineensis var. tenera TaxID=51953 RepID=UPI003C6D43A1